MNCEQQYGFMPGKSTTDAMFALRVLLEKYREDQKKLHCVFVDLEKAYDRVPREELWYCMRKSSVAEKYVRVVQDMFEDSVTAVRCAVGRTDCTVTRSRCGEGGWVKYLGSVVQMNGECGREAKKRVQAGWSGWRRVSGVICDRRVPARVKGNIYKTVARWPAMLYGLEMVALTKRQAKEQEVELKMLLFSLGVTWMDRIRSTVGQKSI